MKFGLAVTTSVNPAATETAQADYVTRLAALAEATGFDSIWVSDRTVFPTDLAARYPDRFGPGRANPAGQNVLEALTTLSFLAGVVKSLHLGISVLVLPFRNPVLNAKMITTLDVLSGGRVIFGVGVGWMPEEFEAMGAAYADRGSVTDEQIELFKVLCQYEVAEYQGKHYHFSGLTFFPKPLQQPHPPIWVGGNSQAALRRAARLGDGWHGIRLTPEEVAQKRQTLQQLCRQYGRPPEAVSVTLRATLALDEATYAPNGDRVLLTGTPKQIEDDLRRYEEAGLAYLVLSVTGTDTKTTIDAIQRFTDEVRR
jgi:probable F420-dependent oxidoreductase